MYTIQRILSLLMCRIRYAAMVACVGLILCGITVGANAQQWKGYTFIPVATDPTYLSFSNMAADLSKMSAGRIDINCYLGGALPIKSQTIVQAVSDGVIQFGMANPNALETFVPFAGVLQLPGLFDNSEQLKIGIEKAMPYIYSSLIKRGVRLLAWSNFPQAAVFGTYEIRSVADMAGKKFRVSTPEQSELIKRLGATPVIISSPEVSSALSTGVIDGVLTSNSGGGRAWKDLFKSSFRLGTDFTPFVFIVNEAAFQKLSDPDRKMLIDKVSATANTITNNLLSSDDDLTKEFAAKGMLITYPEGDEKGIVMRLMKDYWDIWAAKKGGDASKVLSEIRAFLKK
ncbi:MAG: TRAP transporter substrate-binding protein DctP [Proteobacteria bacterium]|nr:TRAP transporter substrate-binding protein DctP [Pseudomonadota bacterium]